MSEKGSLRYYYTFTFSDGAVKEFDIHLDPTTLHLPPPTGVGPEWTSLAYSQCEKCPLDTSVTKACPIAVNIADLITSFDDILSYNEVDVSLETEQRNIWKLKYTEDDKIVYMWVDEYYGLPLKVKVVENGVANDYIFEDIGFNTVDDSDLEHALVTETYN